MARFYPVGGSGGADTSVVTAEAADVLSPKVIVDKDGNPITGTMKNLTAEAPVKFSADNGTSVLVTPSYFVTTNTDGIKRVMQRIDESGYVKEGTVVGGGVPIFNGVAITPSWNQQVINSGSFLTGNIVVNPINKYDFQRMRVHTITLNDQRQELGFNPLITVMDDYLGMRDSTHYINKPVIWTGFGSLGKDKSIYYNTTQRVQIVRQADGSISYVDITLTRDGTSITAHFANSQYPIQGYAIRCVSYGYNI